MRGPILWILEAVTFAMLAMLVVTVIRKTFFNKPR